MVEGVYRGVCAAPPTGGECLCLAGAGRQIGRGQEKSAADRLKAR